MISVPVRGSIGQSKRKGCEATWKGDSEKVSEGQEKRDVDATKLAR